MDLQSILISTVVACAVYSIIFWLHNGPLILRGTTARLAEEARKAGHAVGFGTGIRFASFGDEIARMAARHDARVAELLDANNREVERRRAAERLADDRGDKADAMEAELYEVLNVLIRRINGEADWKSAAEWVRLNYPGKAQDVWGIEESASPAEPEEEGEPCPDCGAGVVEKKDGDGCSCHINPPCGYCTSAHLACDECGWEGARP